jgi:glycosyltransferase involved in cell wall biosynthesis
MCCISGIIDKKYPTHHLKQPTNKPLHIIIRSLTFLPKVGGLENMMHQLADAWAQQGHSVTVVTAVTAEAPPQAYTVLRNPPEKRVRQLLKEADVYIEANISLKTCITGLRFRKKWVVIHHLPYLDTDWKRGVKNYITKWAHNICCSHYVAQTLPAPAVVIPNSYNPLFTHLHPAERPYDFIFAGRMVSDKGVDLLITAFLQYRAAHPNSRLLLVGDGPERAAQADRIAAAGMQEAVTWAGILRGKELVAAYNSACVAVIPSRWPEPFGIVALEALACGCGVVASNGGGLPEAVGPWGHFFTNGDAQGLCHAMAIALQQYPTLQISYPAIQQYLAQFSPAKIAQRYLQQCQQWNLLPKP